MADLLRITKSFPFPSPPKRELGPLRQRIGVSKNASASFNDVLEDRQSSGMVFLVLEDTRPPPAHLKGLQIVRAIYIVKKWHLLA